MFIVFKSYSYLKWLNLILLTHYAFKPEVRNVTHLWDSVFPSESVNVSNRFPAEHKQPKAAMITDKS